jgi:dTDP-4-amino-4,6-dideoxygalactose transaminase
VLRIKLRHLRAWNDQRRRHARAYREHFAAGNGAVVLPDVPPWSRPVHHLYVVRLARRQQVQKQLADAGIGTGIHYPIPLHLSAAYRDSGFRRGDFPIAERIASEILSLPMFPGLARDDQRRVVLEVLAAVGLETAAP